MSEIYKVFDNSGLTALTDHMKVTRTKANSNEAAIETLGEDLAGLSEEVVTALGNKQDKLTFDSTPTSGSTNPVTSTGVKTYIDNNFAAKTHLQISDTEPTDENAEIWINTSEEWNDNIPEVPTTAELDEENVAHFKNSAGVVLFTLDLSSLGAPIEYGDLVVSAESLSITEGGSGTFTVKLASAPNVKQTVYLALSDNTKLSVSPASLVFTPDNWATEQTVTLTAAQDEDMKNDTITVNLTSKNVDGKSLVVSVTDDDIPVLVEDGLGFYISLRNLSSQNSAETAIVDSVGGVACTLSTDIAFDDTSGFVNDNGLTCPQDSINCLRFAYPLKTANAPNGFTVEYTMTGICDVHASGAGHQGYIYKSNLQVGSAYSKWHQCGLVRAGTAGNSWPVSTDNYDINSQNFSLDDEHTYTLVQEVDGVTHCYIDGELSHTAAAPDGFTNYLCSGSMSFAIPYLDTFTTNSLVVSSMRIYERALTVAEVKTNYNYEVSQRSVSDF